MTRRQMIEIANAKSAIAAAIAHFGDQYKFADAVLFSQGSVSRALASGKMPAEMCVNVEVATGGKITREMLRPDIFAAEVKKLIPNAWRDSMM